MLDGHELYAYLPGGASGGILPASMDDIPLDFDTLQPYGCFIGSAAVIVLSQHDTARDAALNMMRFFAHESCGQCTPCRVGTAKAATLMEAAKWDNATLEDLSQVMGDASICGLGQAAPNPDPLCAEVLSPGDGLNERTRQTHEVMPQTIEFTLDGKKVQAYERRNHPAASPSALGMRDPAPLLQGRLPPRRQLPCLRGRDQGRAHAGAQLLPQRQRRAWRCKPPASARVKSQKMVLEMLLSDMPDQGYKWDEQDETAAARRAVRSGPPAGVTVRPELKALRREQPAADVSHPAMAVNLDACIQCNRCVRACREEQVNDVIGYALRGSHSEIVFDLNDPMGESTCVACGECVQACPTGALMPKTHIGSQAVDRRSTRSAPSAASVAC